jgi:hypothetical protein
MMVEQYQPMFPKSDEKLSGFQSFKNEQEFDAALTKIIKADIDILIDLGRN